MLKIGDELFRYVEMSGIWKFIVKGVRQYESDFQYEIESQSCSHGWKCMLLIGLNDYGKLTYISMLNNDDDDRQEYWHVGKFHFYPTAKEAKVEAHEHYLSEYKDKLRKAKESVSSIEKTIQEIKDLIAIDSATHIDKSEG